MDYGKHTHPHTHEHMSVAKLTAHITRYHRGDENAVELSEEHQHSNSVKVNWNHAARIDIHPRALRMLKDAEVVYFGIEGCPKADAILSAICRDGSNASVVSVPAVGMWDVPELEELVMTYLQGKTIVIVPDADWATKGEVEHQARVLQGRLVNLGGPGTHVHIAAPPIHEDDSPYTAVNPKGEVEELKGVDDYLGFGKGTLAELMCIDREPPKGVYEWMDEQCGDMSDRRFETLANCITQLALLADKNGELHLPYRTIGKVMGVDFRRISEWIHALVEIEAVTINGGELTTKFGAYGLDWEDRPTIQLVPELRATPLPRRSLGEVLGNVL